MHAKGHFSYLIYSLVHHCGNSDHDGFTLLLEALDQSVPNLLVVLGIVAVNGSDDITAIS